MSSSMTFTGDAAIDRVLAAAPAALGQRIVRRTLRRASKIVHQHAQRFVPVRTGKLRRSIKIKAWNRGDVSAAIIVPKKIPDEKSAFYARMIEYGTANMAAQPYMRPALAASESEVTAVFIAELREWVRSYRG